MPLNRILRDLDSKRSNWSAESAPPETSAGLSDSLSDPLMMGPAVQMQGGSKTDRIHELASAGTETASSAFPHASTIEDRMGKWGSKITGEVTAHTGADAAAVNNEMGSEAYLSAGHMVTDSMPSLHTAVHEGVHHLQQSVTGVQLKGGVGESGDAHEMQSDSIADKVVAGQNVETELDKLFGGGGGGGGGEAPVQNKSVQAKGDVQMCACNGGGGGKKKEK